MVGTNIQPNWFSVSKPLTITFVSENSFPSGPLFGTLFCARRRKKDGPCVRAIYLHVIGKTVKLLFSMYDSCVCRLSYSDPETTGRSLHGLKV